MNAIELLEGQHREVEKLFKQIENAGDNASREKKQIFELIRAKLEMHAKLEEKLFYPESEEVDEDLTLESYEEHDIVKALLRKISKTKPSDETFMAKVTVLKEMVEHHVEEEEQELFPECKKEFGDEKLEQIGAEMEAIVERAEGRSPSKPKDKSKGKRQPESMAA